MGNSKSRYAEDNAIYDNPCFNDNPTFSGGDADPYDNTPTPYQSYVAATAAAGPAPTWASSADSLDIPADDPIPDPAAAAAATTPAATHDADTAAKSEGSGGGKKPKGKGGKKGKEGGAKEPEAEAEAQEEAERPADAKEKTAAAAEGEAAGPADSGDAKAEAAGEVEAAKPTKHRHKHKHRHEEGDEAEAAEEAAAASAETSASASASTVVDKPVDAKEPSAEEDSAVAEKPKAKKHHHHRDAEPAEAEEEASTPKKDVPSAASKAAAVEETVPSEAASTQEVPEAAALSAHVELEFEEAAAGKGHDLFTMLTVTGDKRTSKSRVPVDIVCLVDHSGSMEGAKIQLLKKTLHFMVTQLSGSDRLSIVAFENSVSVLCGLLCVNGTNKSIIEASIEKLRATGGTDITLGLQGGTAVLARRKHRNPVSSILLLTDGQDSAALTASQRVTIPEGCVIHTFGFGADHDAKVCASIAEMGSGSFTFVESDSSIGPAFATVLGGLLSVVAKSIEIAVRPKPKNEIVKVLTHFKVETKKKTTIITVPDLCEGEKRDLILHFHIPASTEPVFAEGQVTYTSPVSNTMEIVGPIAFQVQRPKATKNAAPNMKLVIQRLRIQTADAITSATELADKRQFKDANGILQGAIDNIKAAGKPVTKDSLCVVLLKDLEECKKRFNESQYDRGGVAYAKSAAISHKQQRAAANPLYCSAESAACNPYFTDSQLNQQENFAFFSKD
ncbi:zinc finger C3HC4-type RING finger family protein [Pelomyxa schiedti]|nr:zinc finger C3HC4-type RING finger family protein [Pelomyxa schiedti]